MSNISGSATPDLTSPEAYAAAVTNNAVRFAASLFLGRGKYANAEADTKEAIDAEVAKLIEANPTVKSKPVITAFDAGGNSVTIGDAVKAEKANKKKGKKAAPNNVVPLTRRIKKDGLGVIAAKGNGKGKAAAKPAKVKEPKAAKGPKAPKAAKALGSRALVAAAAAEGKVPAAPDFSAPTHARFLKKHAELVALVTAGDIRGLKAFPINPISSSPKALAKYRDLAVMALEAKKAADKKAAKVAE